MPFEFNPSLPDITSNSAARVYSIGKTNAVLIIDPPMLIAKHDPNIDNDMLITYLFAMVVYYNNELKMIITSEITSKIIMSIAPDEIKDELKKPSICIFNEDGSYDNLGKLSDWSNIELFCNKSFDLIGERLGETSKPVLLNNIKKSNKVGITDRIKQWFSGK